MCNVLDKFDVNNKDHKYEREMAKIGSNKSLPYITGFENYFIYSENIVDEIFANLNYMRKIIENKKNFLHILVKINFTQLYFLINIHLISKK